MSIRKIMLVSLAFCCVLFSAPNYAESAIDQPAKASAEVVQPVNINTADAKALEKVKGLGPKRAQAIIDYRNAHGNFKSVDELSNIKGIGKKPLVKLAPQLTVGNE